MIFVYSPGDPHDRSAGVLIPVRRPQSCERGNNIASVCILYLSGHIVRVFRGVDQTHFISEPLNGCPGHEDGTFQSVVHFSVQSPGNGSYESVIGEYRFFSRVHQEEAAGSVCVFRLSGRKAGLSEKCCLLIPGSSRNGDWAAQEGGIRFSIDAAGRHGSREQAFRNPQLLKNIIVPLERIDIEQHGSGRVRVVGYVNPSFCQFPDQPGLHCTEKKFAAFRAFPCSGNIVQDPFDLCGGKISVDHKSGFLTERLCQSFLFQRITVFRCPSALPYDCVIDRLAGLLIPYNGSLTLVGNSDGGDIFSGSADLCHCLNSYAQLTGPDLVRIVLHPSGLREILCEFPLCYAAHFPFLIKKNTAVACSAGI